jgi:hypothetical protein
MRTIAIAVFSAAAATSEAAGPLQLLVDLDRPGAMEDVRRANPEHYRKISQIRELAARESCITQTFSRNIQVRFEARDGECSFTLMTTYPGKRRLTFTLDEARYVTVVTSNQVGYRAMPAIQKNAD